MIPMGLGMCAVNAGVLFFKDGRMGTLFLDPLQSETNALMNVRVPSTAHSQTSEATMWTPP